MSSLRAGMVCVVAMLLERPAGEYEFFAAYAGHAASVKSGASNLVAFDVDADGNATLPKVAGR